jgi:hypothetical protein
VPDLWIPGVEGPLDAFVERLHRQIETYARGAGVEQAVVEVELADGWRFAVEEILPEPGWGFLTLRPHRGGEDETPEQLIVPVASIKRIELDRAEEERARFGFSVSER